MCLTSLLTSVTVWQDFFSSLSETFVCIRQSYVVRTVLSISRRTIAVCRYLLLSNDIREPLNFSDSIEISLLLFDFLFLNEVHIIVPSAAWWTMKIQVLESWQVRILNRPIDRCRRFGAGDDRSGGCSIVLSSSLIVLCRDGNGKCWYRILVYLSRG